MVNPIFLGVAERAAHVRDGNTNLFKWNVLGLKNIVISYIYPFPLHFLSFGLAFHPEELTRPQQIAFVDAEGVVIGTTCISSGSTNDGPSTPQENSENRSILSMPENWIVLFVPPIAEPPIIVWKPGTILVRNNDINGEVIGRLEFALIDAPPLTPDRITAIKSDPTAAKEVRYGCRCRHCGTSFDTYAALERSENNECKGIIWYQSLQDEFHCACGKAVIPLEILRRNLHALLGRPIVGSAEITFVPQYEQSSLVTLRSQFLELLDSNPAEESIQIFLNRNPVLLHQFPSLRVIAKPPILTFFIADFAILSPSKELIFIEIERASTRLTKINGDRHSELNHAVDQVANWLHVIKEHWISVLASLNIDSKEVSAIRGVVIAGRDRGHDAMHLRRLKGLDLGNVTFLTYDDILASLDSLINKVGRL